MMGIETMKSVSPKTVDRSTLVQRSSIRLDPAAPREERLRDGCAQVSGIYFSISSGLIRLSSVRGSRLSSSQPRLRVSSMVRLVLLP